MISSYRLGMFVILSLALWSGTAFSQTPRSDSSRVDLKTIPDSTTAPARNPALPDLFPLKPSPFSGAFSTPPPKNSASFQVSAPRSATQYTPQSFNLGNPFKAELEGFQSSTAFEFHNSDMHRYQDKLKPDYSSDTPVVPVLPMLYLAAYGTYKGFQALKGYPPVSFDPTDKILMDLLWANPDEMAVEYYSRYNQGDYPENLAFMTLQVRLDKLEKQRVISKRKDGDKHIRYHMAYSPGELQKLVEEELRKNDPEQQLSRRMELEQMMELLDSRKP